MSSITLQGWPPGATVTIYPNTAPGLPLGGAVTSGTANGAGSATLSGLTEGRAYTAESGGVRRGFMVDSAQAVLESAGVEEPEASELGAHESRLDTLESDVAKPD